MPKPVETYKAALNDTLRQLSEARAKRESLQIQLHEIEDHISDLGEAARSIGKLCFIDPVAKHPDLFPEETEPEMGFTDAVREVFKRLPDRHYLGPVHVRAGLQDLGFPLHKYKNPLASIHTILKRLHEQGELDRMELDDIIHYGRSAPKSERMRDNVKEGPKG